jgi:uncharacterized protein (DUF2249 family)
MNSTAPTIDLTHFDVRAIPCREKHTLIFRRWAELPVGQHFVLINDHDPVPLYYQFAAQFPGAFSWEYLVQGPDVFHVQITRLADAPTSAPIAPPPVRACRHQATSTTELDTRGLEPPEPLMCILAAVEALHPGTILRARTDRRPLHLYPELDARRVRHVSVEQSDGSWITTLERA